MSPERSDAGWIQALSHRRSLVLSTTILATAVAWLAVSRLVAPQYVARARVWAASGGVNVFVSSAILEDVVTDLGLCVEPKSTADAVVLSGFKVRKNVRPGAYRLVSDVVARRFTLFDEA